jgi:hypothetical protein
MAKKEQVIEQLKKACPDGKMSCTDARQFAGEKGIPLSDMGKLCDEAGIKIHSCELGCF